MKGQISSSGKLVIERNGVEKDMFCPFDNDNCGDWCPLFGEPMDFTEEDGGGFRLKICDKRILYFEEFKDNRGGDKNA